MLRKVSDRISYTSRIEPRVKDHWAIFQLYKKVFDHLSTAEDLKNVPWADPAKKRRNSPRFNRPVPINGLFWCESSMFYFKKRKYSVIGKNTEGIPEDRPDINDSLFLGINHTGGNTDTDILMAILD